MPGLTITDALVVLDSLAKQAQNIKESGFDANATGYSNNRTTILAGDIAVAADLAAAFQNDVPPNFGILFDARLRGLDKHLGRISAFLIANDKRAHPFLRTLLGYGLEGAACMQIPVLAGATRLANFLVTSSGVGTFSDGVAVDLNLFGKVWLEAECKSVIGAGSLVITVIGTKLNGSAQSKPVTIPNGSAIGFKINIGTLGTDADHYVDVTSITCTGGIAADSVDINSRVERAISL